MASESAACAAPERCARVTAPGAVCVECASRRRGARIRYLLDGRESSDTTATADPVSLVRESAKKESSESGPKSIQCADEDEFTKIEKIKEKMPPRPRELAAARAARALPRRPARYGFKYKARYGTFIAPTLNSLSWERHCSTFLQDHHGQHHGQHDM
jgi:hypothetical protein